MREGKCTKHERLMRKFARKMANMRQPFQFCFFFSTLAQILLPTARHLEERKENPQPKALWTSEGPKQLKMGSKWAVLCGAVL